MTKKNDVFVGKITKTFLRTEKTMNEYYDFTIEKLNKKQENNDKKQEKETSFLDNLDKLAIKDFKYWVIIPNRFPYDLVAETNHIIFIKRDVVFDWDLLTKGELDELSYLKKTYITDNYDSVWENLPSGQTVPGRFHLHLIKLKREEFKK